MCNKIIYLGVVLLLAPTGFVKGSCLEYGHSCWGAHGKRSIGKIYRSIDGNSESQQSSEAKRDIDPSELLNMLLERNVRMNLDETSNSHDFKRRNAQENSQTFDESEQRLKRKLRDAFRKGIVFHYSPSESEEKNIQKNTEESQKPKRHQKPKAESMDSTNEDNQLENYPIINLDMEYLDLK
ncbi:uncharacterized protein LOC129916384 [Episyrphus balteatus]|uniref:uncharacterized protein LOC129916384 n=1 Tax=Episyrphus balteatus TaxID=286459 RepID=UPI0024850CA0|nr:uncharacterized protein LOC129916384 [Episyrphus balteatus]